jgi:3-oxoacyl-[acyl-carrier-protein] synthase II
MGVISPIGNNVNDFWEGLRSGKNGIGPITRFDTSDMKVTLAAEVKNFDPSLTMDTATQRRCDLFTQYAIAAAQEAVDTSGLEGIRPERFGVYIGSGIGGIETLCREEEKRLSGGPRKVSPFLVPMMIANMASGQVAMRFHAQGPCLPVVTACATGTHALGEAYRTIRHGYADAILAGGAEAPIGPLAVAGFSSAMALSITHDVNAASIPFDKRRAGFVMGEGAGVLMLESLENALKRGANILGEICGYGNTCDAYHITSPLPDASRAAAALSDALEEAGYSDNDTLYINAHGTSTQLNDKTETLAIKLALKDATARTLISSTKSMTGHMLGAAGGAEAIAALLALRNGMAPPTINLTEPDPECDLDYVPGVARQAPLTLTLSLSLGFGGHNACVALRPYTEGTHA